MRRCVELGEKYGRWNVLSFSHKGTRGKLYWWCLCDCGKYAEVPGKSLLSGESQSCGCLWRERITTHGMARTPTWKTWDGMIQRCTNPKAPDYGRYGAKGIKVCKHWRKFENFLADMGVRPEGKTLDRHPDPNGDYKSSNCRWATPEEQQRNRRDNRLITYQGESKLLIDWVRKFGIPYDLLLRRANRGLTGDALFAPSRSKKVSRFKGFTA